MKLEDIKTGGFYFYTERAYGSDYADTLMQVRSVGRVDMAHPIATNWEGVYINETPNDWGEDLTVEQHYDERCWHPCDYTPEDGSPAVWMAENYPLENLKHTDNEKLNQNYGSFPRRHTKDRTQERSYGKGVEQEEASKFTKKISGTRPTSRDCNANGRPPHLRSHRELAYNRRRRSSNPRDERSMEDYQRA